MTVMLELAPEVEQLVKARATARGITVKNYLPTLIAHAAQEEEWQEALPEESLGRLTMLAAEPRLRRVWDSPEEDAAWKYLEDE